MRKIILIMTVLVSSGCTPYWKLTNADLDQTSSSVFKTPAQWMMLKKGNSVYISEHGPSLERISIEKEKIETPLSFTKLKLTDSMMLYELGEILLYQIKASPDISNLKLEQESTVNISANKAVGMIFSYSVSDIACKSVMYAFIHNGWTYKLMFSAVNRYYFDNGFHEFEEVVKSFKIR
jgi:hypothetical protein